MINPENSAPRQSNFELLRIVAMIMVVGAHCNGILFGDPTPEEINSDFVNSLSRTFFQGVCITSVPVFCMISGWFGIKFSSRRFAKFIFQCVFLTVFIIAAMNIAGVRFGIWTMIKTLAGLNANWFVMAYIGLFIISPVLNLFAEKSDKRTYRAVIICLFVFECTYGWYNTAFFVSHGYSLIVVSSYYMLARYMRIHTDLNMYRHPFAVFVAVAVLLSLASSFSKWHGMTVSWEVFISFPEVIMAVSMFICFAKLKIRHSRIINRIAASSFAVYYIHTNPLVWPYYIRYARLYLGESVGMSHILHIFLLIACVFTISVFADGIRIWAWDYCDRLITEIRQKSLSLRTEE